ncbi:uncharacterized protein C19orf47 homolog isoform X1 [Amblyraja radiata]|uniref:uncharacterized protein C19orf47 homolog isoform X1 n=1 Tax=Amblyraja radiata TaxID=386614 RepID=UPI00140349C5|nr:uncharacterized protein C19orf47 homolog isoform X1 [Amblyraja radiata]XP_032870132.1 uncharacterized protein C19orf47 homolog isoform X1 [Amblyraja radiata]
MVSVTLATSEWIQFFKDAGIPAGPAVNYAVSFVDNRIQRNMLMDLTKDIMNELGIMVVGDIIAVLKHAKVVYKQELAKMATESITPTHGNVHFELKRTTGSPATRMIANSLSRESPPTTPVRRPEPTTSKISVTVANKLATKKAVLSRPADPGPDNAAKRRRVTAEMEGKYKINMPQGTTAKTKKILEQQTTKGLSRMSVFDRLGAETKADTTTGSKPTGVFSRLGEVVSQRKESSDDEEVGSVLQYAGVLKRAPSAPVPESPKPPLTVKGRTGAAVTTIRRLAVPKAGGTTTPTAAAAAVPGKSGQVSRATPHHRLQSAAPAKVSIRHRLGKAMPPAADTQDNKVTSTKSRSSPEFTVTIKNTARTPVPTKVSSSTEGRMAQMDSTGTVSVFERLGMKLK